MFSWWIVGVSNFQDECFTRAALQGVEYLFPFQANKEKNDKQIDNS